MKIYAPVHDRDGSSFYRLATPTKYLNSSSHEVLVHKWSIHKFAGSRLLQKPFGTLVDYLKLAERWRFAISHSNDPVWLSRSLLNFKNVLEQKMKHVIYDFDDALWLSPEASHCFRHYCENSVVVFAGNQFLADYASSYSKEVHVIPSSIDVSIFKKNQATKDSFRVGWIGSSAGLPYLQDIESQLIIFFEKHPSARLVVVSERQPLELARIKKYIEYIPWTREAEADNINSFSVGLMPLRDTDWDRGKCALKMLQYMACEVPVMVNPIGANLEVMNYEKTYGKFGESVNQKTDWTDILESYYSIDLESLGVNGRKVVTHHYSSQGVAKLIQQCFDRYL